MPTVAPWPGWPRPRGSSPRDLTGAGGLVWRVERERLVGLAYRVLGSVADAEEVVQEAFLRLHRTPGVADPAAWLTTVVSRLCLDQLGSARSRREEAYAGQWLPEPPLARPGPQEEVALAESVTTALLVVLEALSPLERVVFVLHEAFGFDHPAVAAALCRSPASVRQLASRARRHVRARRPRFDVDPAQRDRAARAFLAACAGADLQGLLAVLDPEAVRCSRCWTPRRCCAPTAAARPRHAAVKTPPARLG